MQPRGHFGSGDCREKTLGTRSKILLYIMLFCLDKDITTPESIVQAAKKAGMSEDLAKKLLTTITTPEIKNKLKETTDKALEYGVFGMPSIVAHIDGKPELFFGSDRFELLAHLLGSNPRLDWGRYSPVGLTIRLDCMPAQTVHSLMLWQEAAVLYIFYWKKLNEGLQEIEGFGGIRRYRWQLRNNLISHTVINGSRCRMMGIGAKLFGELERTGLKFRLTT
ncbi:unnamed protein product [Ranitomeya imitator]|uniref:DSBA-like thioredoxin domain-containing protein n=1 Tax=Ranitomeya imitator TaxID=111125 RepID=A0ABN9L5T6_9NEOB|nr:unnamed protein product [Ranitomeya imitator]